MSSMAQPIIDVTLAFEWEADEYAAIASYQLTHHLFESGSFAALRPLGVDFAWGLASSMVFLIIARLSKSWTRGSRTHPPAFVRYVWSMMSVEGAPECVSLSPNTASLQAGFAEVGNWFKRNEIQISPEDDNLSTDTALHHFKDQYDQVRAVLAKESDILKELEKSRSEMAQERLRNVNE